MKGQPNPTEIPVLLNCIRKAEADGYVSHFEVTKSGLYVKNNFYYYKPEEVVINSYYQFELTDDPSENTIMYLVETKDGRKGILINAYEDFADPILTSFVEQVEKNSNKSKYL
ncbi:hypothetical protein WG954_15190 [Lacibacter sp. H375]|uniref:hypothetical protein n=1 Tax=Lacibacter sp. H375 TaxID=3133424 RepID=UPI0030BF0525